MLFTLITIESFKASQNIMRKHTQYHGQVVKTSLSPSAWILRHFVVLDLQ